jgi:hypothetical protein
VGLDGGGIKRKAAVSRANPDPLQDKSRNRRYTPMHADPIPQNAHNQNLLLLTTVASMPKRSECKAFVE